MHPLGSAIHAEGNDGVAVLVGGVEKDTGRTDGEEPRPFSFADGPWTITGKDKANIRITYVRTAGGRAVEAMRPPIGRWVNVRIDAAPMTCNPPAITNAVS